MKKLNEEFIDLKHEVGTSLPSSPSIHYQCLHCWKILPSRPADNVFCDCGNVSIDVDAGRAGARNENLLRVLEIKKNKG